MPRKTLGIHARKEKVENVLPTVKSRLGPDGLHLFDRRTGLNVLFDEVDGDPSRWARGPRQVSIALTNACDLSCRFCYAPKTTASLEFTRVLAWLDELDAAGCFGVGFGGGEPTLYRRLPEVCRYATERTALAVTMTTHAHRFTPRLMESLVGTVHFVRVSVDGVGLTYEAIRGRPYADLVSQLHTIRRAFKVGLNCVVNEATLSSITAVAELADQVEAAELLLLAERPTSGQPGASGNVVAALHEWVRNYRGPVPIALGEGEIGPLAIAAPLPRETGLRAYAHIDASATLRETSYHADGEAIDSRGVLAAIDRLQQRGS